MFLLRLIRLALVVFSLLYMQRGVIAEPLIKEASGIARFGDKVLIVGIDSVVSV